ncbi:MAG: hypothetical protein RSE62_03160 [Citrobacter sp.]
MSNTAVITFDSAGAAQAMYRDAFPLNFLGELSVSRASEIKFNERNQNWDILLVLPNLEGIPCEIPVPEATGFAGYDLARKIEVEWLDAARLDSVEPTSAEGLAHLKSSRERNEK